MVRLNSKIENIFRRKKDFQIANLYSDDYGYYSEYRGKPKEFYKKSKVK